MDYNKINFRPFSPNYEDYLNQINSDKSVSEFVNFSKSDSRLIFYEDDFVGCFKTMIRDDDLPDKEIYIGLTKKYRGKGISKYVISKLSNNIFESDNACEYIHLSIDKDNIASINMAKSCGFTENIDLENELREYGDNSTLVFSIRNPYLSKQSNMTNLYQ